MQIISQGFWNRDSQQVYESYKLIQICPIANQPGEALRLSLRYDDNLQTTVLVDERSGLPPQIWDWRSSGRVLRQLLLQAGFNPIDAAELKGMTDILESGEAVLEGQSNAVTVISARSDNKYAFDRTHPMTEWIRPSELQNCDRQPAP